MTVTLLASVTGDVTDIVVVTPIQAAWQEASRAWGGESGDCAAQLWQRSGRIDR